MKKLKQRGIKTGILTDVAYGMDNAFSLENISVLSDFIHIAITSVNVGYRKPNPAGYLKLLDSLEVSPDNMIFVGDKEKNILGAKKLGIVSALINRGRETKDLTVGIFCQRAPEDNFLWVHLEGAYALLHLF